MTAQITETNPGALDYKAQFKKAMARTAERNAELIEVLDAEMAAMNADMNDPKFLHKVTTRNACADALAEQA